MNIFSVIEVEQQIYARAGTETGAAVNKMYTRQKPIPHDDYATTDSQLVVLIPHFHKGPTNRIDKRTRSNHSREMTFTVTLSKVLENSLVNPQRHSFYSNMFKILWNTRDCWASSPRISIARAISSGSVSFGVCVKSFFLRIFKCMSFAGRIYGKCSPMTIFKQAYFKDQRKKIWIILLITF